MPRYFLSDPVCGCDNPLGKMPCITPASPFPQMNNKNVKQAKQKKIEKDEVT